MNIAHVNYTDLPGRRFNGYDLHLSLNELGHDAKQFVVTKYSDTTSVIPICSGQEFFWQTFLAEFENFLGMDGLINPNCQRLNVHSFFENADIAHYHILRNGLLSLLDLPYIMNLKPSVWTIHELSFLTGSCIYPLECNGWTKDCSECEGYNNPTLRIDRAHAREMLAVRKSVADKLDIDFVVASEFTASYMKNSAVFSKMPRIHKIPFGIDVNAFRNTNRHEARSRRGIPDDNFVISFRCESNKIKGCEFLYYALKRLPPQCTTILTIGGDSLPQEIVSMYHTVQLGWQDKVNELYDFYAASDVFVMPSLAETFGLMAIEAMASGLPVISFEGTVLPEITFAPECGIAVPYKDGGAIASVIERLCENKDERLARGDLAANFAQKHYCYKNYVDKHVVLYNEIYDRRKPHE